MRYSDQILETTVGELDLLKNIDFAGEDLAAGESVSSISSVVVQVADEYWGNLQATTDVEAQSNGASGTVAQVKITKIDAAGKFVITVTVSTSNGQVLVAQCRLLVK